MIIIQIIGMLSAGYLGYIVGYEMGWFDKGHNKKHKLRKKKYAYDD